MNKSSFFIVGKHAVFEALKNEKRKILKVFLTEESKKNIHRLSPKKNLLKDVKIYFKTKKELDKYSKNEGILHQGYVAEIEHLEKIELKEFISDKNNLTSVLYVFLLSSVKKSLKTFRLGFLSASITACFPTIKKDDLFMIIIDFYKLF